ncbi:unnamed protein product [Prorocentrum cordatum]|uniref:Uncharacterized protein n=1 Tax=Prorocentrum cordatum TaxID=2364126 RepID=A0ABN9TEE8_9DINO|nr:unnamed protein product [Polarella glacialis]
MAPQLVHAHPSACSKNWHVCELFTSWLPMRMGPMVSITTASRTPLNGRHPECWACPVAGHAACSQMKQASSKLKKEEEGTSGKEERRMARTGQQERTTNMTPRTAGGGRSP